MFPCGYWGAGYWAAGYWADPQRNRQLSLSAVLSAGSAIAGGESVTIALLSANLSASAAIAGNEAIMTLLLASLQASARVSPACLMVITQALVMLIDELLSRPSIAGERWSQSEG